MLPTFCSATPKISIDYSNYAWVETVVSLLLSILDGTLERLQKRARWVVAGFRGSALST
jgi:hypothetical protein